MLALGDNPDLSTLGLTDLRTASKTTSTITNASRPKVKSLLLASGSSVPTALCVQVSRLSRLSPSLLNPPKSLRLFQMNGYVNI